MTSKKGFGAASALVAFVLTGAAAQAEAAYTFTTFDTFGGSWSVGLAVNSAGVVVGTSAQPPDNNDPPNEPSRAAKWNGPTGVDLGTLGGAYGSANGINDGGTIVGSTNLSNDVASHATLWRADGTMVDLGTLGGLDSSAFAINKAGVVVGFSNVAGTSGRFVPVVWRNGQIKALKSLGGGYSAAMAISNKGNYIAGRSSDTGGANHAVVWKDGALTDLGENRFLFGINSSGTAVGYAPPQSQGVTTVEATAWNGATPTSLGCLRKDFQCIANAINDSGTIVGESRPEGSNYNRAVMWTNGKVVDLNTRLDQASRDAGWTLLDARAISSNGSIAGLARNTITGAVRAYLLAR